jgi:hypothetical protein
VHEHGRTIAAGVEGGEALPEDDITLGSLDNTKESIENESVGSKENTARARK